MPLNPVDNMPEALRRHNFSEKFSMVSKEAQMNGTINFGGSLVCGSNGHPTLSPVNPLMKQGKVACLFINVNLFNFCIIFLSTTSTLCFNFFFQNV